jgi:hypothetical protein
MIYRQGTTADIDQVLLLQDKYLLVNVPEASRSEGFVTTPFSEEQLKTIIAFKGLFVAEDDGKIVAYVVVCSWDFFIQFPIFAYMASRFGTINFHNFKINTVNSFEYGPICIDSNYRNKGVFQNLFESMRTSMADRYKVGVTFINKLNKRSFSAHTKKLNLKVIDEFSFNQHEFYTLAFWTDESVINKL